MCVCVCARACMCLYMHVSVCVLTVYYLCVCVRACVNTCTCLCVYWPCYYFCGKFWHWKCMQLRTMSSSLSSLPDPDTFAQIKLTLSWRDGPVVNRACCSSTGPEFGSQNPQRLTTDCNSCSRGSDTFWSLRVLVHTHTHTHTRRNN
jgi:hypothetical protein